MPAADAQLLAELSRALPADGLLTSEAARLVYARDASHLRLGLPLAVALPRTAQQAAAVLAACARWGFAVTCRGAGTGLSGGAVPAAGTVVLSLARLTAVGPVDVDDRCILCEAGVTNERVSRRAAPVGLHFAPDPSSQSAATIGGNVAENAGGPHCLRYGVTAQHVRRLAWLDAAGAAWTTGHGLAGERQIDLASLLCGSEGTLGVVTEALLSLTPEPQSYVTLLAYFASITDAARAVADLLGAGLLPLAIEMVDQAMLGAVEEAFAFGFATEVAGAMIVEFGGDRRRVEADAERARSRLSASGAGEIRTAADAAERAELWRCRKRAFGAFGRLAPAYISMDVVVPLSRMPALIGRIEEIKRAHGVVIATAFHAGDGNVHPGVELDEEDPAQARRAHATADAILREALACGGSISGEHGVGLEKRQAMAWQVEAETVRLLRGVKAVFDPDGRLNPDKALPPVGAACAPAVPEPSEVRFAWNDLTVTAPASTPVADLQAAALARGFWLPVGVALPQADRGRGLGRLGDVGGLIDTGSAGPTLLSVGTVRDILLEVWAETGDHRRFHAGAPVVKNVVGYDLARLLCGAGGVLARVRAATLQLRPAPAWLYAWRFATPPGASTTTILARLGAVLAGWDAGLAAPLGLMETDAAAVGQVLVCAAGAADDGAPLERELCKALTGLGEPAGRRRLAFADGALLAEEGWLPAWALAAADWTRLTRRPGHDSLRRAREAVVPGGKFIWQAVPAALWLPQACSAPGTAWHADTVWRQGAPTPLPEPAAGVPRDILAGLKRLFDPEGTLPTPAWLAPAVAAAAAKERS